MQPYVKVYKRTVVAGMQKESYNGSTLMIDDVHNRVLTVHSLGALKLCARDQNVFHPYNLLPVVNVKVI